MRGITSAPCQLRIQSDRPLLRRLPMDATNIRSAALRADVTLQARGGHTRAKSYGAARGLGHATERFVSGYLQRHIPR